jgi:hypothetical protein
MGLVQKITYTATSATTPTTWSISPTTQGNTLVVVESTGQFGSPPLPYLNGTSLTALGGTQFGGERGLFIYLLTNIAGGYTTITWPGSPVPALAVIYEYTPCTLDASAGGFGGTTGTETCPAITPNAGTGKLFINAIGTAGNTAGNYPEIFSSVASPWSTDYTGQLAGGVQGQFHPGVTLGIGIIASGSGTQQAVWTSSPGGYGYGAISLAFTFTGGGSGGGGTVIGVPIQVGGGPSGGGGGGGGSCSSTLNISPATELYQSFVPAANMVANIYLTEGRTSVVIDFNSGDGLYSRDIETMFAWGLSSGYAVRVWQPSLIAMPEQIYNRPTDWIDGGNPGNKFIQGVTVEADSFNLPKTFQLQSADDLSLHSLNEMPATFAKQTIKSFSCVTPFLAHSVRLFATDAVAWRTWGTKLIFQPWPEQVMNWQTEQTSFGITGWLHAREMNIAYASATPLTVVLVPDVGPSVTLTLASSGGSLVQAKTKQTLPAMKFKLLSIQITSTAPFYLFDGDLEFKIKPWGSTDPYSVLKVIGGQSRTGAEV